MMNNLLFFVTILLIVTSKAFSAGSGVGGNPPAMTREEMLGLLSTPRIGPDVGDDTTIFDETIKFIDPRTGRINRVPKYPAIIVDPLQMTEAIEAAKRGDNFTLTLPTQEQFTLRTKAIDSTRRRLHGTVQELNTIVNVFEDSDITVEP